MSMIASSGHLEGVGMSKPARKTLTEDQVLLIAKALGDRRRYEILKRLGERQDALACGAVRDCTGISPATLSHHMKELEISGLVAVVRGEIRQLCLTARHT
jgi:ArsR family transcriptional regulator